MRPKAIRFMIAIAALVGLTHPVWGQQARKYRHAAQCVVEAPATTRLKLSPWGWYNSITELEEEDLQPVPGSQELWCPVTDYDTGYGSYDVQVVVYDRNSERDVVCTLEAYRWDSGEVTNKGERRSSGARWGPQVLRWVGKDFSFGYAVAIRCTVPAYVLEAWAARQNGVWGASHVAAYTSAAD